MCCYSSLSSILPLWRNPCCQPPPGTVASPLLLFFFPPSSYFSLQPHFQSYFPLSEMYSLFLSEPLIILLIMVLVRRHFVRSIQNSRWIICFQFIDTLNSCMNTDFFFTIWSSCLNCFHPSDIYISLDTYHIYYFFIKLFYQTFCILPNFMS